eukprot:CAMPEP_0113533780 /NCGR_PEP_ID=MMETSP0015_2-20120614/4799_1 /TAXON_ID=2838 /ORGANISM="Odontella" /LENGTH=174 /DNA_ID=CAMNT_0000432879 /DNA_START=57 /DNA_END=582 /DNA_ORIENTATION=- /assembly_acc=CAM_ASM_000160
MMRHFLFALAALVVGPASSTPTILFDAIPEDFATADAVSAEAVAGDGSPHYGDPTKGGCLKDEHAFKINGIPGGICSSKCTAFHPCPTDVPEGVTAQPMCALKSPTGEMYCALICSPKEEGQPLRASSSPAEANVAMQLAKASAARVFARMEAELEGGGSFQLFSAIGELPTLP